MDHKQFKASLEAVYDMAKRGISKEDKQLLLEELDELAQLLEAWKKDNN